MFFIVAFFISIDAFFVGISLGTKNIRLSFWAKLVMLGICFASSALPAIFGHFIQQTFTPEIGALFGSSLLFAIGIFYILSELIGHAAGQPENGQIRIASIPVKPLGITLKILKSPETSDTDHSGVIDTKEVVPLSIALCMDVFAASLGIGAMGWGAVVFPFAISISHFALLWAGIFLGGKIFHLPFIKNGYPGVFAGLFLIAIALSRLVF